MADALEGRDPEAVAVAVLVVSELVSNAVRHASIVGDRVGLEVLLHDDQLHVEVTDRGDGFHVAREMAAREGYGLGIVDGLADAWGVERGPPHRVWCDLSV